MNIQNVGCWTNCNKMLYIILVVSPQTSWWSLQWHPAPVSLDLEPPAALQPNTCCFSSGHRLLFSFMFQCSVFNFHSQSRGPYLSPLQWCPAPASLDLEPPASLHQNNWCFSSGHRLLYSFLFQCSAFHFHSLNHTDGGPHYGRNCKWTLWLLMISSVFTKLLRFSFCTVDADEVCLKRGLSTLQRQLFLSVST